MLSESELNECKESLQKIINNHLPEEKRFSVSDFSQEEIWYLSRLLLAENEEEKNRIWKEIEDKQKENHKSFLLLIEDIKNHKEKYETVFNTIDEINSLNLDIDLESELSSDASFNREK